MVDNAEIKATHIYGENGSFKSKNSIDAGKASSGIDFSYIKMNNDAKATEVFATLYPKVSEQRPKIMVKKIEKVIFISHICVSKLAA